jgi:peroxiredoxin
VVLVVWGSKCPGSRAYGERLEALRRELAKGGGQERVVLLALAPNRGETPESIEAARREAKLEVPVLLDPGGAIAKDLGAVTTPTAYLIDAEGRLRYQGAIDDDPQGKKPKDERTSHLAEAVKAVLAGAAPKRVKVPATGFKIKF